MKVVHDMVNFDKDTFKKLEAHLTEVQKNFMGSLRHDTVQTALQKLEIQARDAHFGYRSIFESAFKNLEDHVKEVQNSHRNKFHRANFQKLYRAPSVTAVDSMPPLLSKNNLDPRSYQEGLCSSLKVFQIRKWRPMTSVDMSQMATRSRSAVDRPKTSPAMSYLRTRQIPGPQPPSKHNPKDILGSTPLFPRKPITLGSEIENLDTLDRLVRDPRTLTSSSTLIEVIQQLPAEEMLRERYQNTLQVLTSGLSITGRNSDGTNSGPRVEVVEDIDNDCRVGLNMVQVPPADMNTQLLNPDLRLGRLEMGQVPLADMNTQLLNPDLRLGRLEMGQVPLADLNMQLLNSDHRFGRLETADLNRQLLNPDLRLGRLEMGQVPLADLNMQLLNPDHRFGGLDQVEKLQDKIEKTLGDPSYGFECPLPSPLDTVDLCLCAKENRDWRHENGVVAALDPLVSAMFDRLVELEKLQIETREWEVRRMRGTRKRSASRSNKPRDRQCSNPGGQSVSAGDCTNKPRDRQCSDPSGQSVSAGDCPNKPRDRQCSDPGGQSVSAGDCPNKTHDGISCDRCIRRLCTDASKDTRPQTRSRQPGEETKQVTPFCTVPSQNTFSKNNNIPIFISVNGVSPARPKSAIFKLNRSRISSTAKDQRPASVCNIPGSLFQIPDKLGLYSSRGKSPSNTIQPQPNKESHATPIKNDVAKQNSAVTDPSLKRRDPPKPTVPNT